MKYRNQLSPHSVEYAFLQSEWYSGRYDGVRDFVEIMGLHLANPELMKALLYLWRYPLFRSLPADTKWYQAELNINDIENINVIKEKSWIQEFGRRKTLRSIARKIEMQMTVEGGYGPHASKIEQLYISEQSFLTPLILLKSKKSDKSCSVFEGNHRAVSFCFKHSLFKHPDNMPIALRYPIVGISKNMDKCVFYNR